MIGIVILNYCNWEETINCVDNILEGNIPDIKIYIVDNDSPNDSYDELIKHFGNNIKYSMVCCTKSKKNGGYAYGNNIGIKLCEKDNLQYAIITNSDVLFKKDTIKILCDTLKENTNSVIVAPKVVNSNGEECSIPWINHQNFLQFLGLMSINKLKIPIHRRNEIQKVFMVAGCCYSVNINLFTKMGAIDEGTFLYCEEGTIAMQAFSAKLDIIYNPNAVIIHNHKDSNSFFSDKELLKSILFYWKKYEKANSVKLYIIKIFYKSKMYIKKSLNKYYDVSDFNKAFQEIDKYYISLRKGNI